MMKYTYLKLFMLFISIIVMACSHSTVELIEEVDPVEQKKFSFLALGDSYTIGHNVDQESSFPFLLKSKLTKNGFLFPENPKIIAKTGWTCDNLSQSIDIANLNEHKYDLVTLLIGVNDQYSGHDINTYPANFTILLNKAILYATSKENVIVLSIPDYSVTPFGGNSIKTAMEIAAYNKINKKISDDMGIKYVNITSISLKAKDDLSYLANDKLHPSEKMYIEWVAEMYDEVLLALKK